VRASLVVALVLFVAACRDESDPSIAPGRLQRAPGAAGRSLRALVPDEVRAGETFPARSDGAASLVVLGTGLTRGDRVRWGGHALETTFGNSRLLTAAVPPALLAAPGPVTVTVEDPIDPSQPTLRAIFRVLPERAAPGERAPGPAEPTPSF
jgi:hypothetical protein